MAQNKFSASEAVSYGWSATISNIGFFIAGMIIIGVFFGIDFLISWKMEETALSSLVSLVSYIASVLISIAIIKILLNIFDGPKGQELNNAAASFQYFFKVFCGELLYGAIVFLGLLLLIVPGIIWSVRYSMYKNLIIDKGMSPVEALRKSKEMTKGNVINLIYLHILIGFINILGLLALGIGLFVTIPLSAMASIFVYRKLLTSSGSDIDKNTHEASLISQ